MIKNGDEKQPKKHHKKIERVNDKFKGMPIVTQNLLPDDDRLPMSLLSYEQYKEAVNILNEAMEKRATPPPPHTKFINPNHPVYALVCYLRGVQRQFKGTEHDYKCVICGEPFHEVGKLNSSLEKALPFCIFCGRLVRIGKIRGRSMTRGLKYWGKICPICERKPVVQPGNQSTGGLCRSCYRLKQRLRTKDNEELKAALAKSELYVAQRIKPIERPIVKIVKKDWGILNELINYEGESQ